MSIPLSKRKEEGRPNYSWWERTSRFLVQKFRDRPLLRVLRSQRDYHMMPRPDLQRLPLAGSLLRHYPKLLLKVPEIDQRRPHRFAVPGMDTTMESDIEKLLGRPSKRKYALKNEQEICMRWHAHTERDDSGCCQEFQMEKGMRTCYGISQEKDTGHKLSIHNEI
jgi:hypothetical protein